MIEHICHARGCEEVVPPRMFMCRKHWYMLTSGMRDKIWLYYAPGQERRKDPSPEYVAHASVCVKFVAQLEHR